MKILTLKTQLLSVTCVAALMAALNLFTGCNPDREPTAPVEVTRPKTNGFEPENGKLAFPVDQPMKIIFTEPMNVATFMNHFTLKDRDGNLVEGTFKGQDSIVYFVPSQPFNKAMIYTAELKGRIRDAHNNSIQWNGDAVLNDTTLLYRGWFFTEGDYSKDGYYHLYLRDRKSGAVRRFSSMDQVTNEAEGLNAPEGMALTEDGNSLIISNTKNNELAFVNTSSQNIEAKLPMPKNPSSIVIKGDYAYVVCADVKTIVKVKISSKSREAEFVETFYPGKLAISNDGNTLYTLDQAKRDLVLIKTSDGTVIKKMPGAVDKLVTGEIKVDPSTGTLYICDAEGLKLKSTDKDASSLQILNSFASLVKPIDVAFDSKNLIVAAGKNIYKYDKSTNQTLNTVSFSTGVKSLTLLPSNDLIYATLATSVVILDAETFTVLKEIDLASSGIESIISSQTKY